LDEFPEDMPQKTN